MTTASCKVEHRPIMQSHLQWHAHRAGLRWCIFALDDQSLLAHAQCLAPHEQAKAARFHFAADREHYIAAHVTLRQCLSVVTATSAADLIFASGPHGKPRLISAHQVQFNISHSANIGMIALADSCNIVAVGADVEAVRPIPDWRAMSAAHFSPAEQHEIECLSQDQRDRYFLRCWTRKEACLKALGTGFSVAPSTFTVGGVAEPTHSVTRINVGAQRHSVHVATVVDANDCIGALAWCLRGEANVDDENSSQSKKME